MTHYTYRAEWSVEEDRYISRCLEWPLIYGRAPTAQAAIDIAERMVAETVADYQKYGDELPPSISDHRYSGKFMVRTSAELHAKLTIEAAEQGVSLNQWAVQKLSGRMPSLDDLF